MLVKRAMVEKLGIENAKKSKQPKSTELEQNKANQSNSNDYEETIYLLQREKTVLQSKLKNMRKELSEMRDYLNNLEFQMLQNPEKKKEKFKEFSINVEMWSKYFGITIEQTIYIVKQEIREWHIEGTIEELKWELRISCATNELTNNGYIKTFNIKTSASCKQELGPWFENVECNIEQIFKVLKAYSEMNKEREIGLDICKKEYDSIITVYKTETFEDTIIELGTVEDYYFQIKWKLVPSRRHFAKVKNVCRIACTDEGDKYIKANTDLSSIKKRLSRSPIEIIQLLARGIANSGK